MAIDMRPVETFNGNCRCLPNMGRQDSVDREGAVRPGSGVKASDTGIGDFRVSNPRGTQCGSAKNFLAFEYRFHNAKALKAKRKRYSVIL